VWQNPDEHDERFSPEELNHRSIQIVSHILCISRDMILLWILEDNVQVLCLSFSFPSLVLYSILVGNAGIQLL